MIHILYTEIEEKGFKVRLTIIDTPGFGDYVNNQDCWVPVIEFLDEQHQNHMQHEARGTRDAPDDLRVHVCLYFIQPTGHTYVFYFLSHSLFFFCFCLRTLHLFID